MPSTRIENLQQLFAGRVALRWPAVQVTWKITPDDRLVIRWIDGPTELAVETTLRSAVADSTWVSEIELHRELSNRAREHVIAQLERELDVAAPRTSAAGLDWPALRRTVFTAAVHAVDAEGFPEIAAVQVSLAVLLEQRLAAADFSRVLEGDPR